jgi:hypothetical protein
VLRVTHNHLRKLFEDAFGQLHRPVSATCRAVYGLL